MIFRSPGIAKIGARMLIHRSVLLRSSKALSGIDALGPLRVPYIWGGFLVCSSLVKAEEVGEVRP